MLIPVYTNKISKDIKRSKKQGKDLSKFKKVAISLINEEPLCERLRDHALSGNLKGRRECHIEPDWLLIYAIIGTEVVFERLGSHSELFG